MLAATLIAASLLTAPSPSCAYLVRHAEPVRSEPSRGARVVDHLGRGDRVVGACRWQGRWLTVVGTRRGRQGFAPSHSLDRIGTLRNVLY